MIKGDIVRCPTGKLAQYLGANLHGSQFVYVDERGKPLKDKNGRDGFSVVDKLTLRKMEVVRV